MTSRVCTFVVRIVLFAVVMLCVGCVSSEQVRAEPGIRITSLTPMRECGYASGTTSGINPADYYAALLIYMPGSGWWSKPYGTPRVVTIQANGTWSANACTGGIDNTAAIVEVYLIPKSSYPACYPAAALGTECVPQGLKDAAVACDRMLRPGQRTIRWSEMNWVIKLGIDRVGPGSNYFSDSAENAWVDEQGRLHLRITKREGDWFCAEIYSEHRPGYGTYRVYLDGRVDDLDPNIVFGIFTWSDHTCEYYHREIDIEFARWGVASNLNTQFAIQPAAPPDLIDRFNTPAVQSSTHQFTWGPGEARFASYTGHECSPANLIHQWSCPKPEAVPPTSDERLHLNLWLHRGLPPVNGQEREVILNRLEFEPAREPEHPVRGISNRDIKLEPAAASGSAFRVWGRVMATDCRSLLLNDGSPVSVQVIEPGHTVEPGDYAIAEGLLLGDTLNAAQGRVWTLSAD